MDEYFLNSHLIFISFAYYCAFAQNAHTNLNAHFHFRLLNQIKNQCAVTFNAHFHTQRFFSMQHSRPCQGRGWRKYKGQSRCGGALCTILCTVEDTEGLTRRHQNKRLTIPTGILVTGIPATKTSIHTHQAPHGQAVVRLATAKLIY